MFQTDFSPHRDPRLDPVVEPLSPEQLEMLVLRLREHVQVKQIRVSEHFQDADPLRANSITSSRFRQVSPCVSVVPVTIITCCQEFNNE